MNDQFQISIHAALVDSSIIDQHLIAQKVHSDLIKNYFRGGIFKKLMYYFAENEIKQFLESKHKKNIENMNHSDIFFHTERTAFAYRSNIVYHYNFGTYKNNKKNWESFYCEELNTVCNNYILWIGEFLGKTWDQARSIFSELLSDFMNNDEAFKKYALVDGIKLHNISSDLLLQLQSYRANIALCRATRDPSMTMESFKNLYNTYLQRYQQIPLVLRIVEIQNINQANWVTLTSADSLNQISQLEQAIYQINLAIIPATKPFGEYDLAHSPYTSWATRLWLLFKKAPRWFKILLISLLVGATSFISWWTLLAFPLIIFLKQFFKTKADYMSSVQAYLWRFSTQNSLEKLNKADVTAKVWKFSKRENDTHMVYTKIQPNLIDNPPFASALSKNVLIKLQDSSVSNSEELTKAIDVLLAHLYVQNTKNVPTFVVEQTNNKEELVLLAYKTAVLGASIIWYNLSNKEQEHTKSITFKNFVQNYSKELNNSTKAYHAYSRNYALKDGLMSGVISGFTSWISAFLINPSAAGMIAYASSEFVDMTVEDDSLLQKWLLENNMDPSHHQFSNDEIKQMLQANPDIRIDWDKLVYTWDITIIDVQLVDELKKILPEDAYEQFIDQLQSNEKATLWDTMKSIAGLETGNDYSHQIVEQIWKADANWSSEIFLRSVENWLPIEDIDNAQWDKITTMLDRTYDYPGYEEYMKWNNKERLVETFAKLSESNFSVEEIAKLTTEQRAVLTHSSFINIDTTDLKNILLDYSGEESIVWSMQSGSTDVTNIGNWSVDTGTNLTWSNTDGWVTTESHNIFGKYINSIPVPYGKNTFVEHPSDQKVQEKK